MKGTVKSKAEVEALFKTGSKYKARGFVLIAKSTPEQRGRNGRVAYIAGKRLGNAPRRNQAKRLLRHASQEAGGPVEGMDMAFVAGDRLFTMDFSALVNECARMREQVVQDKGKAQTSGAADGKRDQE